MADYDTSCIVIFTAVNNRFLAVSRLKFAPIFLKANSGNGGIPSTTGGSPLGVGNNPLVGVGTAHSNSPTLANIGRGHGLLPANNGPLDITGGRAGEKILAWAMEQRRIGKTVTFDGLCDQALAFVSQDNPGSAYSSTRRWVDHFLNLKMKDVLDVQRCSSEHIV